MPIQTERLILRMFREDDFESYAKICADPEVMTSRLAMEQDVYDRCMRFKSYALIKEPTPPRPAGSSPSRRSPPG